MNKQDHDELLNQGLTQQEIDSLTQKGFTKEEMIQAKEYDKEIKKGSNFIEYIKLDRDKSTFKSHRDFSSEKEISFKHF